jgi:hypothetical protein
MALQKYSNALVMLNGSLLTEENSVSVDKKSGLNPVHTTANGFSGMSQGAPEMTVRVDNAVPAADFEYLPDEAVLEGQVVEITIFMAGKQTTAKGFITDVSYSHAVNSEAKMSFNIMCEPAPFE